MVTAELPPFAKPGQRLDVTVSALGQAKSLRGGTLLLAPMQGADGEVYALAQGNLAVGGFGAEGRDGQRSSSARRHRAASPAAPASNAPSPPPSPAPPTWCSISNEQDFSAAQSVAAAINMALGSGQASVVEFRQHRHQGAGRSRGPHGARRLCGKP